MIKKILLSLLICIVVISVYSYHKAKPLHLTKDTSLPFPLESEQREILYYASLAPNAHNVQPWRLTYNKNEQRFTLAFDSSKALPHIDPAGREAWISLGAFLENFRQAATAFGMQAEIDILSSANSGNVPTLRYVPTLSAPLSNNPPH